MDALVITPVKDSIETTLRTIEAISKAESGFEYVIYNDFSKAETKQILEEKKALFGYELVHLEVLTTNPSPNYKLILQLAQKEALIKKRHLIIVESDVIIRGNTLQELVRIASEESNPGLIGAITTDENGKYNFPYLYEKAKSDEIKKTSHSLSFCCTLLSHSFLEKFDFTNLSDQKDWFDIYISRKAVKSGFTNYLAKNLEVIHLPHSSRPWKNLKYTNPFLYYLKKYFYRRDRI